MMPVTAYNLLQSIDLLAAAARNLGSQCVSGLTATGKGPEMVERGLPSSRRWCHNIGLTLSRNREEGPDHGRTVKEVAAEETDLSSKSWTKSLTPPQ